MQDTSMGDASKMAGTCETGTLRMPETSHKIRMYQVIAQDFQLRATVFQCAIVIASGSRQDE